MRVVLPLERDAFTVEGAEPMIADGDAMRVPPEVAQYGGGAAEGRLRIDDPVGLEEGVDEGPPLRGVAEVLGGAGEIELASGVGAAKLLDKLPTKEPTEDLHREEEAGVFRVDPALVIGREPAGRHHAMHVRMADQRLAPRVEDGSARRSRPRDAVDQPRPRGGSRRSSERARCTDEHCSDRSAAGVHAAA